MSQNSNTLLLFFSRPRIHKVAVLMLHNLGQGNLAQAQNYADKLGIDIPEDWHAEWFNHEVSGSEEHIQIYYETGTCYELPLAFLKDLFGVGLKGAAIEVFLDQVGETYRAYFHDDQKVDKKTLLRYVKRAEKYIETEFEFGHDYQEDDAQGEISELIEEAEQADEQAMEAVTALRELSKQAYETGQNPLELMRSALIIKAGVRGVAHACLFALVTILLFKGLWLWVALSVVLLVALPLIYISQESRELEVSEDSEADFEEDEDDFEEDEDDFEEDEDDFEEDEDDFEEEDYDEEGYDEEGYDEDDCDEDQLEQDREDESDAD